MPPKHFFVSYAHTDKAAVRQLVADLERAHIPVWIDTKGLEPGTVNWELEIRKAIEDAVAVIFMASPDAAHSTYVKAELELAKAQKCRVYPLWLRGDEWIKCVPLDMASAQYIDLRDDAISEGFATLIDILKQFLRLDQPTPQAAPRLTYVPQIEPLPLDAEEVACQLMSVSDIQVKQYLRQKKDTAQVVLVDVKSASDGLSGTVEGPHYLKIHGDDDEIDSIKQAMTLVDSAIGPKIPLIVDYAAYKGRLAVLYKPALGSIRPQNIASLAVLLESDYELALDNIHGVSELLFEWNQDFEIQQYHPFDLLRELLEPRRYEGESSVQKRVWRSFKVSDQEPRLLFGGELLVPNPLAFLTHVSAWQDQQHHSSPTISTPVGHAHGDLHADNLICNRQRRNHQQPIRPDILDFATYRPRQLIFFDFAYLEFDIISRICPPDSPQNRWDVLSLLHFLASESNFKLEQAPSGTSRVSTIVRALRPLRNAAAQAYESLRQHAGRKEDFETAYWIASVAAGLNYARKRTPSVTPYLNFLGLMYAGVALKRVLDNQMISYRSEHVSTHKWIEPDEWGA